MMNKTDSQRAKLNIKGGWIFEENTSSLSARYFDLSMYL